MVKDSILVSTKITFIEERSNPAENHYVYAYTITIKNEGARAAQLISRHWRIKDALNKLDEVRGTGVVGEQPRILPGQNYTYTSGVVLETQTGTMEGSYQMQTDEGEIFEAEIPTFALVPPHAVH